MCKAHSLLHKQFTKLLRIRKKEMENSIYYKERGKVQNEHF